MIGFGNGNVVTVGYVALKLVSPAEVTRSIPIEILRVAGCARISEKDIDMRGNKRGGKDERGARLGVWKSKSAFFLLAQRCASFAPRVVG